ncbi:MAG: cupredoxin family copper-binding protein [bacterium]|nr:cupredoxin family copper-binding protein [bacterium]
MKKLSIGIGVVVVAVSVFVAVVLASKEGVGFALVRELMASVGIVAREEITVEIANMAFPSSTITVRPGTKVTWVNKDVARHNVLADDGSFKTELIGRGESVSVTFQKEGAFSYYCGPHPFMKGVVTVVE